jgi:hypothetical protein
LITQLLLEAALAELVRLLALLPLECILVVVALEE